jgi:hypothetical protein
MMGAGTKLFLISCIPNGNQPEFMENPWVRRKLDYLPLFVAGTTQLQIGARSAPGDLAAASDHRTTCLYHPCACGRSGARAKVKLFFVWISMVLASLFPLVP